jgi:hypothetical protein
MQQAQQEHPVSRRLRGADANKAHAALGSMGNRLSQRRVCHRWPRSRPRFLHFVGEFSDQGRSAVKGSTPLVEVITALVAGGNAA